MAAGTKMKNMWKNVYTRTLTKIVYDCYKSHMDIYETSVCEIYQHLYIEAYENPCLIVSNHTRMLMKHLCVKVTGIYTQTLMKHMFGIIVDKRSFVNHTWFCFKIFVW